jgi:thioredoxin reductase
VIGLDGSDLDPGRFTLKLSNNERVSARSVVIASGARYRQLAVDGLESFEGASVHYWASPLEAKLCAGQEVALVGAGNSAGQAAVYLASHVSKVWLLVRGPSLAASMSRYLVDRIANVEVVTQAQVSGLEGNYGCCRRSAGVKAPRERKHGARSATCCGAEHRLVIRIGCSPGPKGVRVDWGVRQRRPPAAGNKSARRLCHR